MEDLLFLLKSDRSRSQADRTASRDLLSLGVLSRRAGRAAPCHRMGERRAFVGAGSSYRVSCCLVSPPPRAPLFSALWQKHCCFRKRKVCRYECSVVSSPPLGGSRLFFFMCAVFWPVGVLPCLRWRLFVQHPSFKFSRDGFVFRVP